MYEISTIGDLHGGCSCGSVGPRSTNAGIGDALSDLLLPGSPPLLPAGGWVPKFVYPSDVTAAKRALAPEMAATDAVASRCAELPLAEAQNWGAFYSAWKRVEAQDEPLIFGASNAYDEVKDYEAKLHGWQALIAKSCGRASPGAPDPAQQQQGPDLSAMKWVAGAVALVAIAYILSPAIAGLKR